MKIIACRVLYVIAFLGVFVTSCSKSETNAGDPTIELISGEGLIAKDTSATEASSLHFKVHCKWNGEQPLTNLIVYKNGTRIVDEGMNINEFEKSIDFAKDSSAIDSITFVIRDIKGSSSSTSLKVEKKAGSGGGELIWYYNITLEAQNAPIGKCFLSLLDSTSYTLHDACAIQQNINLLYYYDAIPGEGNIIASPGANVTVFTGTYGLSNWTTRNTIYYIKISLTQEQFEAINDPVFVVNAFNAVGNRKAKGLVGGETYSFNDKSTNKYGILRVYEIVGQDAGKVVFSIVMQK